MIEVIERINKGDFWAQRPKRTKRVVPSSYDRDTRGVGDVAGALRKTSAGAAGGRARGGHETVPGIVGGSPQLSLRRRAWRAPVFSTAARTSIRSTVEAFREGIGSIVPVCVAAEKDRNLRIPVVQFLAHVGNSGRPLRRAGAVRKISLIRDCGAGILSLPRPQACGGWYTQKSEKDRR